jgi:outer membrane receptor for ferrienterochelin and colicins
MATGALRGQWKLARARKLSAALSYALYRDQFAYDQRGSNDLDKYDETIETLAEATALFDGAITREHYVTAGVEGMREYLESPRLRQRSGVEDCDLLTDEDCDRSGDRYRSAVFAQDEWMILSEPSLVVVPALRVDADSQFGTHVSPKLAMRWDPNPQVVIRASYGRGFRAPDFKQLYLCHENPNAGYFVIGNPDLGPENSHNMNLGVEVRHSERVWFTVNFYYNLLDNLIAFDLADPAGMEEMGCGVGVLAPYTYRNIESAFTRGVETLMRTRPNLGPLTGISMEVGYVLTDSRDQELDGPLPGRAQHRGTFQLGYEVDRLGGFGAFVRGSLVGERRFDENLEAMNVSKPHATIDARMAQTIRKRFTLFAGIKNLLNVGDPVFLPVPPRTFYGGVIATY